MSTGNEEGKWAVLKRIWRWTRLIFTVVVVTLLVLSIISTFSPIGGGSRMMTKGWLLHYLTCTKQIYYGAQCEALDFKTTGEGKGGYPADIGVKSGLEYIRYLVQRNVLKEADLKLFCLAGKRVSSIAELKAENIAYRFANVSSKDSPETIFIVTRNVVEGMPAPKKWWDFSKDDPFAKAYVVMRLGGDGSFYTKLPPDLKTLGDLPPREPKFLEP